jgi:AdoMet-dependent rRNA methyltransferase SPB1
VEDEKKHMGKYLPVTKEEVQREKEALKAFKERLPKKVLEAKMRKKKRIHKSLERAQT